MNRKNALFRLELKLNAASLFADKNLSRGNWGAAESTYIARVAEIHI